MYLFLLCNSGRMADFFYLFSFHISLTLRRIVSNRIEQYLSCVQQSLFIRFVVWIFAKNGALFQWQMSVAGHLYRSMNAPCINKQWNQVSADAGTNIAKRIESIILCKQIFAQMNRRNATVNCGNEISEYSNLRAWWIWIWRQ